VPLENRSAQALSALTLRFWRTNKKAAHTGRFFYAISLQDRHLPL
jgi:hypothetical protein